MIKGSCHCGAVRFAVILDLKPGWHIWTNDRPLDSPMIIWDGATLTEITAKIAKGRWRVYEVGISYSGRTYEEGKKIGWRDGVRAIVCILKYNLFR